MRPTDIDDGLRLCRASGWNQTARDWEQFLSLGPDGACVAVLDRRVVGTVATMRYAAAFGWIGMVLVEPGVRGRGIGTLMLDRGLELLSDMPLVRLDATPAGYPIYLKRDFVEEYRLHRLRAAIGRDLQAPAPSSVRQMREDDLSSVIEFDQTAFGANRAAMLRWMWCGAREYAWIAGGSGGVAGYAFGRHGHLSEHLGPVVAANPDIAADLATACLRGGAGREFIVDALLHSQDWLGHLGRLGFRLQRELIRMSRGSGAPSGHPSRQFAILGPEFG
jgi:GNAT superfamily N-acetyltransferase